MVDVEGVFSIISIVLGVVNALSAYTHHYRIFLYASMLKIIIDLVRWNTPYRHYLVSKMCNKYIAYRIRRLSTNLTGECVICYNKIEKENIKLHNDSYHKTCLMTWLKQSASCPTCNLSILRH